LKFHPAAEVFPLLVGKEFAALVSDIKEHGQIDPILVLDGMILDGRNRWRACREASVEPKTKDWPGGNPWDFVWSKNAERRHLEPGQKAAIRYKVEKGSDAWLAKRKAAEDKANRARSEAAKDNDNAAKTHKKNSPASREAAPSKKKGGPLAAGQRARRAGGAVRGGRTGQRVGEPRKGRKAPDEDLQHCADGFWCGAWTFRGQFPR